MVTEELHGSARLPAPRQRSRPPLALASVAGVGQTGVLDPYPVTDTRSGVDRRSLPRRRARWVRRAVIPAMLIGADVLAVVVAIVAIRPSPALAAGAAILFLVSRAGAHHYRRRLHLSMLDDLPMALGGVFVAVTVLALFAHQRSQVFALAAVFVPVSLVLQALAMATVRHARRGRGAMLNRTLIIGAGRVGSGLAESMLLQPEMGLRPIGFTDVDALVPSADLPLPVLSRDMDMLSKLAAEHEVDAIVLAFSTARESDVVNTVIAAHRTGSEVFIVPRMYELHRDGPGVERVRGIPLLRLNPDPTLRPSWWIKRAVDVLVAGAAMLLISPVLAVIGLAVLVESGRPMLFWQERVGLDNHTFRLCKFRSMRPANELESATNWSIAHDPRVGRVGRFLRRTSLDEIPQLWNIVRGDMSLVGPRPERPVFVQRFSDEHERYWARHRVPVGLTGLAQVNGLRGDTSIHERSRYDNYYIANWSLWLDVKILLLTFREVVRGSGR